MSKKPDTASALAGILQAKRGDDRADNPAPPLAVPPEPETHPLPSPAPLPPAAMPATEKPQAAIRKARSGKSSDKANYSQYSVYLRKSIRKKVGRALDDADTGQDFSELVEELLEQWLASRA
jgi:hypothetical protein